MLKIQKLLKTFMKKALKSQESVEIAKAFEEYSSEIISFEDFELFNIPNSSKLFRNSENFEKLRAFEQSAFKAQCHESIKASSLSFLNFLFVEIEPNILFNTRKSNFSFRRTELWALMAKARHIFFFFFSKEFSIDFTRWFWRVCFWSTFLRNICIHSLQRRPPKLWLMRTNSENLFKYSDFVIKAHRNSFSSNYGLERDLNI